MTHQETPERADGSRGALVSEMQRKIAEAMAERRRKLISRPLASIWDELALAAMQAMREPTPVMLSVGDRFAFYSRGIWRAMLYAEIAAAIAGDSHDR